MSPTPVARRAWDTTVDELQRSKVIAPLVLLPTLQSHKPKKALADALRELEMVQLRRQLVALECDPSASIRHSVGSAASVRLGNRGRPPGYAQRAIVSSRSACKQAT
jgi:hypothetical protein